MNKTTYSVTMAMPHLSITFRRMPHEKLEGQTVHAIMTNLRIAAMFAVHALCDLYEAPYTEDMAVEDCAECLKKKEVDPRLEDWLNCINPFVAEDTVKYYSDLLHAVEVAAGLQLQQCPEDSEVLKICLQEVSECKQRGF